MFQRLFTILRGGLLLILTALFVPVAGLAFFFLMFVFDPIQYIFTGRFRFNDSPFKYVR